MAEEEASSGGHLRRDGQVGRGEEEQARGEQAALAVPLRHGQGGGRLCGLLATDTDDYTWHLLVVKWGGNRIGW